MMTIHRAGEITRTRPVVFSHAARRPVPEKPLRGRDGRPADSAAGCRASRRLRPAALVRGRMGGSGGFRLLLGYSQFLLARPAAASAGVWRAVAGASRDPDRGVAVQA